MDKDLGQVENTFTGGLNKDLALEKVPADSYIDANDISLLPNEENETARVKALMECGIIPNPASVSYPTNQMFRARLDVSASSIVHEFNFYSTDPVFTATGTFSSAQATPLLRFNDLVAQIDAAFAGLAPVVIGDFASRIIRIEITNNGFTYTATEKIGSGAIENLIIVQENHTYSGTPYYDIVGLKALGDDLFILIHTNDTGMIAVAKKNESTGVWTSTRLIQSINIDVSRDRVCKIQIEQNNEYINMYWVDGTAPKTFSIKKQTNWVTDSALKYTASNYITPTANALYTYDNVSSLTNLQLFNNTSYVSEVEEAEGGVFINGNKQLAIRFKIGGGYTNFSVLKAPFSLYPRNTDDFTGGGGDPGTITSKALKITLDNVRDDIYEEYQIGVIEYTGGAVSSYVIGTFPVLGKTFTQIILGNENKQSLGLDTFNDIQPVFKSAQLNELIENKYFIGRMELVAEPDLSSWVENTMFSTFVVKSSTLRAVGSSSGPEPLSEYLWFYHIKQYVGYMYNDRYRFGVRFYLKNGLITKTYFGKDVTITDPAGAKGNLTTFLGDLSYIYHPTFTSLNFSTAPDIDGKPFLDVVEGFEIMRTECIPKIVDTGILFIPTGISASGSDIFYKVGDGFSFASTSVYTPSSRCAFISQNILINNGTSISPGMNVVSFGNPIALDSISGSTPNLYRLQEYTGYFNDPVVTQSATVQISKICDFGQSAYLDTLGTRQNIDGRLQPNISVTSTNNSRMFALKLDAAILNTSSQPDYRGYYAQIQNDNQDARYGAKDTGVYISTGAFTVIDKDYIYSDYQVFGGDTYTQKCYHRTIYEGRDSVNALVQAGVSYYAQNRFNAQLSYTPTSSNTSVFPLNVQGEQGVKEWLTTNKDTQEIRLYDNGYTYRNNVRTSVSFDSDLVNPSSLSTVYYSDEKLEGDLYDPYRNFRLANSKTYEMTDGPLTGLYKIRGNLAVLQERSFRIQGISPNSLINSGDVGALILGTGSVIGSKDNTLTQYGSQKINHSILYSVSSNGTEYICFYDNSRKTFLRYGIDGLKPISTTNFMRTFFLNNTQFIQDEFDLTMGYNPVKDEVWIMGNNPQGALYTIGSKAAGTIVKTLPTNPDTDPTITYEFYNQFKALQTNSEAPQIDGSNFSLWEINRNTNFTLAFNERFDSFSTFYTLRPRISTVYNNRMISVFPFTDNATSARSAQLVENDVQEATSDNILPFITQTPWIRMALAAPANYFKRLIKMWVNIDGGSPDRVLVETDDGTAASVTSFDERRGRSIFNVPKDFYGTGQRVGGNKIKIKMFFNFSKKVINFVSTVRYKDRKFNS